MIYVKTYFKTIIATFLYVIIVPLLDVPINQKQWHDWLAVLVFFPILCLVSSWAVKEFLATKFLSKQNFLLYTPLTLGAVTAIVILIQLGKF